MDQKKIVYILVMMMEEILFKFKFKDYKGSIIAKDLDYYATFLLKVYYTRPATIMIKYKNQSINDARKIKRYFLEFPWSTSLYERSGLLQLIHFSLSTGVFFLHFGQTTFLLFFLLAR